jgi:hypothetical protein
VDRHDDLADGPGTDVMQVLWDYGPSVVAEVRERLSDALAYTTVLTGVTAIFPA